MIKKLLYSFFLILLISTSNEAQELNPKLAEALQHTLDSMQQQLSARGLSAALILPNDAVWAGASGISSLNPLDSLTTDHIFAVASTSKTLTGACILQLQEEGLLSIEDSLHQWLPTYNNLNGDITIRQLLTHKSGLFDVLGHPNFFPIINSNTSAIWEPENVLTSFLNPPDFQAGNSWAYSNTNYILLGMIIEAATGNTYHQEIRNRFFEPLNLDSYSLMPFEDFTGDAAHLWLDLNGNGIQNDAHNFITNYDSFFSVAWSAGAFWANSSDLASWIKFYHTAGVLQDSTIQAAHTTIPTTLPNNARYGLGISKRNFLGLEGFGHGGDVSYSAGAYYFPEKDIGLAINCNDSEIISWELDPVIRALLQTYIECESVVSTNSEDERSNKVSLSPNPFSHQFTIQIEVPFLQNVQVELWNSFGALIHTQQAVSLAGINKIEVTNFDGPSGLYFYKIKSKGRILKSGKLMRVNLD